MEFAHLHDSLHVSFGMLLEAQRFVEPLMKAELKLRELRIRSTNFVHTLHCSALTWQLSNLLYWSHKEVHGLIVVSYPFHTVTALRGGSIPSSTVFQKTAKKSLIIGQLLLIYSFLYLDMGMRLLPHLWKAATRGGRSHELFIKLIKFLAPLWVPDHWAGNETSLLSILYAVYSLSIL